MAYPWLYYIDRLLSVDDVLYHSNRLDASLFLSQCERTVRGTGCTGRIGSVYGDVRKATDHGILDGCCGMRRRVCVFARSAEWA